MHKTSLLFSLCVLFATGALAQDKAAPEIPELTKEYVKHCYGISVDALTPYDEQLDVAQKMALVCHEYFTNFEKELSDKDQISANQEFLRKAKRALESDDENRLGELKNKRSRVTYTDSEVEKLLVLLETFGPLFYVKDYESFGGNRRHLLLEIDTSQLTRNHFIKKRFTFNGKDLDRAHLAIGYAATKAIDKAKLKAELSALSIDTPAYSRVIDRWLLLSEMIAKELEKLETSLAKATKAGGSYFRDVSAAYQAAVKAGEEEKELLAKQEAIIADIMKGKVPGYKACTEPMLRAYIKADKKTWKVGIENPIHSRSRELARRCAGQTNNAFAKQIALLGPSYLAWSPFAVAALALRDQDALMKSELEETVEFEPVIDTIVDWFMPESGTPIGSPSGLEGQDYSYKSQRESKARFVLGARERWENGDVDEHEIKISVLERVTLWGEPYVIVGGKAAKVTVPNWKCTETLLPGWEISGRVLRRRTSRKCVKKGTRVITPNEYKSALVPALFAKKLKVGSWVRLVREGTLGDAQPLGKHLSEAEKIVKKMSAHEKRKKLIYSGGVTFMVNGAEMALPACVSRKKGKCADLGGKSKWVFKAQTPESFPAIFGSK